MIRVQERYRDLLPEIFLMDKLAKQLIRRLEEAVNFNFPEFKVVLERASHKKLPTVPEQVESIIEEFMILATRLLPGICTGGSSAFPDP